MMRYKLSDDTWDDNELSAIREVLDSGVFLMGKGVAEYEKEFAAKFGVKYAVMTSSGSTANLLAESVTENTNMACLVNLLGNPNDFARVKEICGDKNLDKESR